MNISLSPRVSASRFTLAVSLLLATVYNVPFWRTFASAAGSGWSQLPLFAGSLLLLVLVFNGVLTLVNTRYVIKPVVIVLCLTGAVISYFISRYGVQIDRTMIQNVVETDAREARELFDPKLLGTVVLIGIVPSVLIARSRIEYRALRRELLTRLGILGATVLACVVLLLVLFKSLAPILREHRELRFLLTPTNGIQAVSSFLKARNAVPVVVAPLGKDATQSLTLAERGKRSVTIIVVGETARARNFSLNGYGRPTNPELARQTGLINFRHVQSCGTATAVSLPCVFSAMSRDDYDESRARAQEGLLDVLAHAGFQVLWRDNNSGCKGACDRIQHEDLSVPEKGNQFCVNDECYDERLLDQLPEMIRAGSGDMVVVLHQKGSHGPAYSRRYPAGFGKFGPVCDTVDLASCSQESIVAAYDNTILYTDHMLSRTIDLLRNTASSEGIDTAMLYFSDHGESLGEHNVYLHGAPYVLSPPEQREVPMMLWLSDGYAERFHIDRACVAARADQQFSHDNVFHSVLGLLRVRTAVYNPHLDIVGPCTRDA